MSGPSLKLPRGADELLRDFPMSEPDFEAQAKAIEARLQTKVGVAALDDVLGAPELAPEPEEPALSSAVQSASTPLPKSNFAEMARKSLQRKEDDDSAALAKELLAATGQARRPDAEMVARVRAAGKPAPTATPLPNGERASGVVARIEAGAVAAAPVASPAPTSAAASSKRGVVIGLLAAALAVAAAFALVVRPDARQAPAASSAALEPRDPGASPAHAPAAADNARPASAAAAQADDGAISPEALAVAANDSKPSETKNGAAKSPSGGA
ncbi:MAG TPA: hypothetical protein VEQ58_17800, partial [Polyangiaceae bacterium]|nr:hypothetical protein [Polyangiaceae bacterium]